MNNVRVRRSWRVWFYGAVAVVAPFTVPSALQIPDSERIAVISGWVAAALVYTALAWKARGDQRETRILDVVTVLMFLLAALYQARWPEWRIPGTTPAFVGGLWAASALGSTFAATRRAKPKESNAPPA